MIKKAGIDLGSTLIKIALQKGKKFKFYSQADYSKKKLFNILKNNNISKKILVGINADQNIAREIKLQIQGSKALTKLPKKFVLISVGTGVSYTIVNNNKINKLALGNSLGGGFLLGMSKICGFKDFNDLVKQAEYGDYKKVDLYFKDLIIANLAKLNKKTNKADLAAGLMNIIAITIYKDMMLYKLDKEKIYFIGTTLNNNSCLKKLLKKYLKNSHFIKHGEFATALGALLSLDN